MASSESSSDEEFNFDESEGIKGYQWEPEYTETELAEMDIQEESSSNTDQDHVILNLDFCTCGHCQVLPTIEECKCCKDFEHFVDKYIGDDVTCISLHEQFDMICLNNTVLETAYVPFLRYKRFNGRAPDILSPSQSRLMGYRQFICWVRRGQPLGKKNRVVLPSCVVSKIRDTFPEPNGQYEGFHDADESSSESD